MIKIQDLSRLLAKGTLDQSNITIFLIEDKGVSLEPVTVYGLNTDSGVTDAVRAATQAYLKDLLVNVRKEEIQSIPEYNPDHSQILFQIARNKVEAESFTLLASFLSGVKAPVPFQQKEVQLDRLKAWVFRFEYEERDVIKQMYFFQKFQASKMLGAKKISIFQVGGEFTLLNDFLLTMNESMDFFLYEDMFVASRMYAFEKTLGYEAFYKENACSLLANLQADGFPDLDYRVTFCDLESTLEHVQGSTRIAHKLYSAKANGYFRQIDFAKLEDLNARYGLRLDLDPARKEWNIDPKANLQVVSQILNDDYGRSQLTDFEYLALAKEKL